LRERKRRNEREEERASMNVHAKMGDSESEVCSQ